MLLYKQIIEILIPILEAYIINIGWTPLIKPA